MKGLLARKRQGEGGAIISQKSNEAKYAGPGHNLNMIADQVSFTRNPQEGLALEFFSKAVVYFGRYPLPVSSRNLAIFWDDDFDAILKSLLSRLSRKIS
jgi:hypothetical protein